MERRTREQDRRAVGAWIKAARRERQWTQTELGERWGVSQEMVSMVEVGKHAVAYDRLLDLCAIFEVDVVLATDQIDSLARGDVPKTPAKRVARKVTKSPRRPSRR